MKLRHQQHKQPNNSNSPLVKNKNRSEVTKKTTSTTTSLGGMKRPPVLVRPTLGFSTPLKNQEENPLKKPKVSPADAVSSLMLSSKPIPFPKSLLLEDCTVIHPKGSVVTQQPSSSSSALTGILSLGEMEASTSLGNDNHRNNSTNPHSCNWVAPNALTPPSREFLQSSLENSSSDMGMGDLMSMLDPPHEYYSNDDEKVLDLIRKEFASFDEDICNKDTIGRGGLGEEAWEPNIEPIVVDFSNSLRASSSAASSAASSLKTEDYGPSSSSSPGGEMDEEVVSFMDDPEASRCFSPSVLYTIGEEEEAKDR